MSRSRGILNYRRTKVPLGVVEAVNGNIKALLRRGRGFKNLRTCSSRRNVWQQSKRNSSSSRKRPKMQLPLDSCSEPKMLEIMLLGRARKIALARFAEDASRMPCLTRPRSENLRIAKCKDWVRL